MADAPGETVERRAHREAWWKRMSRRMDKASERFSQDVRDVVLLKRDLDDDFYDDLLEVLVGADVGMTTAEPLVAGLRRRVKDERIPDAPAALASLKEDMVALLAGRNRTLWVLGRPSVVLVVGVNGNGKTTTIGKLAHRMREDGYPTLVAAADTYRAAAIDQLRVWARRAGVDIVANQPGSDPAAVTFDAVQAAMARGVTAVLVDTAGRLHTKAPLMEELRKIKRVCQKVMPDAPHEILLVLEAPTGMNGIAQVRSFHEALGLTGLVLTKLDGTSRGGTLLQIEQETNIPVKLVGMGEGIDDLGFFDPRSYLDALFAGVLGVESTA
ncbi:MAG TPA: signal recognition particle-docking protein FtsY [Candidatus Dormibacteraeota bacterium]|nr:signal recognition particle-docking protein FtsY [Candidatus Dormibacteraeota bacterium]